MWQPWMRHRATTGWTTVANVCARGSLVMPASVLPPPPAGTSPTSQAPRTTTSAIREDRRASIVADEYMQTRRQLASDVRVSDFGQLPRTGGERTPRRRGRQTKRAFTRGPGCTGVHTRRVRPTGVGLARERQAAPDVHLAHRRPVPRAGHGAGAVPSIQVGLTRAR